MATKRHCNTLPCHIPSSLRTINAKNQMISLILKIVINCRTFVLCHALLLAVHFSNLSACCSSISLLVITHADKAWESKADPLAAGGINTFMGTSLVAWAEGQVCCLDLPDISRLEPNVRLMLATRGVRVKGLGPVNGDSRELFVEVFQNLLGKPSADIAYSFVCFRIWIVAGQEECTIHRGTLAFTIVSTQNNKVQGIANPRKIVLLDL